ncbi:hypothetical protein L9F63_023316, partial [Diploptera punctata]
DMSVNVFRATSGLRRLRDRELTKRRRSSKKRKRSTSSASVAPQRSVTEEEVARTYTGLDREIAEEFIAIAMEAHMLGFKLYVQSARRPSVYFCVISLETITNTQTDITLFTLHLHT